jgi:hypothetical protein
LQNLINAAVSAVVAVVGGIAAVIQAVLQPGAVQNAAAAAPPPSTAPTSAAPPSSSAPPAPAAAPGRAGPAVCDGMLCAEFVSDSAAQGRLKVTFTPNQDLPNGFLGVVTGPDNLQLTGASGSAETANTAHTGYFDVGNAFRKGQNLCTTIFAIDGPGLPAKRGQQLGNQVCVTFQSDPPS